MKPQDFYFMCSEEEKHTYSIVAKKFWHKEHHIDDQHFPGQFPKIHALLEQLGFYECSESAYRPKKKSMRSQAKQKLLDAGFTETLWGQNWR